MGLKTLIESINEYQIPENLKESLIEYIMNGRPTGGFLQAVLRNDLMDSYARADRFSREAIGEVVKWIYNKAPRGCWGSEERYTEWIEAGGLKGLIE